MLVSATRAATAWVLRAFFYVGLFAAVAVAHVTVTATLGRIGWAGGLAMFASGVALLAIVLATLQGTEFVRNQFAKWREAQRRRFNLPSGPCCLVWPDQGAGDDEMPWEMIQRPRVRYPRLARAFEIEGVAVVDFEVNAEGAAKNVHCADAWPSDIFFDAARDAMRHIRFEVRGDIHPRFGASYRMAFVFRIEGAARPVEPKRPWRLRLRGLDAALEAARAAVGKYVKIR